jgi:hypothetical protein
VCIGIAIQDLNNDGIKEILMGFVHNDTGYSPTIAAIPGNNVGGHAPQSGNNS